MTDAKLTELLTEAAGYALAPQFAEIDAMSADALDAKAAELCYDWWRTDWTLDHKRAQMKHAVYLGWAIYTILPEVLADDANTNALGEAASDPLVSMYKAADSANIYGQIDTLPEGLLDILAQDFRVVWYDANADVYTKRAVFKSLYEVYRHIGTPSAVDKALGELAESAQVSEWFEYNGKPYHFKIAADLGERFFGNDAGLMDGLTRGLSFYKNVRSVLDALTLTTRQNALIFAGIACAISETDTYLIPDALERDVLIDENGNILTDENGGVLTE